MSLRSRSASRVNLSDSLLQLLPNNNNNNGDQQQHVQSISDLNFSSTSSSEIIFSSTSSSIITSATTTTESNATLVPSLLLSSLGNKRSSLTLLQGLNSPNRKKSNPFQLSSLNNNLSNSNDPSSMNSGNLSPRTPPRKISKPKVTRVNSLFKYLQGELDVNKNWTQSSAMNNSKSMERMAVIDSEIGSNNSNAMIKSNSKTILNGGISNVNNNVASSTTGALKERPIPTKTEEEIRNSIYNFIHVPWNLEKYFFFGFSICLDSLLFHFTFFPLRMLFSLFGLLRGKPIGQTNICEFLKTFSIIINVIAIYYTTDYSLLYHVIRGETVLKLFMFHGILEVLERLFSSFEQNSQTSMYFSANDPNFSRSVGTERNKLIFTAIFSFIVHTLALYIHTVIALLRIVTLNIALNSRNQSLLTLLISTNFVEIKANIFKKSVREALFQLSCNDIVERFEIVIFSIVIFFQNSLSSGDYRIEEFLYIILYMMSSEMAVDSIKHSFICKFNDIQSNTYQSYKVKLAFDLSTVNNVSSFLDNANTTSRRIGFVDGPIISLILRLIIISVERAWRLQSGSTFISILLIFLTYCCLFLFKVLIGILLFGHASKIRQEESEK